MSDPSRAMPPHFAALRTHVVEGRTESRLERVSLADLSAGEVVVRTRFAGVNYKDCLSLHGQAKIITSFPRIAGIEFVGDVVASAAPGFQPGQAVLVHGFQTGIAFDGGFAEYARVPAAHLHAIPAGLTPQEAAVLGVAGFTVAIAVEKFEEQGIAAAANPIAVSGATGGVGLLALAILSRAGWRPAAITRRMELADGLRAAGAAEVIDASVLQQPQRALEKARFAAAIDNVGGPMLSWLLRSLQDGGSLACVGNAGGNTYEGSVLPFIMRRVQMFGIVANAPWPQRHRLWERLATDLKPDFTRVMPHVHFIGLEDLMAHSTLQLQGKAGGRVLVKFGD